MSRHAGVGGNLWPVYILFLFFKYRWVTLPGTVAGLIALGYWLGQR